MQHCTPASSLSRCVQSLHGMNEEIKLIVFLKMMKEIVQKSNLVTEYASVFARLGRATTIASVQGRHDCAVPVPSGRHWLG